MISRLSHDQKAAEADFKLPGITVNVQSNIPGFLDVLIDATPLPDFATDGDSSVPKQFDVHVWKEHPVSVKNIQETRFRRFETVSGRYTACDGQEVLLGDDGINSIRDIASGRVVIYILSATGTISTIAKWILASRTVLRMNIAVAADSPTALGVHASSVAWGHNGGLIVGKEGQGKTTTALACAGDGGSLLSEDISGICKGSDQWNIVSMPSMPGLDVRTSKLLKISLGDIVGKANLRRSTKFWLPPSQLPWMKRQASARLRGVFTLRRCSDSKPSVRPMPASEMLGHFLDSATRALITSSADMGGKLTSLGKVLAEVPCFELSTPEGAPHLAASELRRILDRVSRKEPGVAAIAGRMT